MSSNEDEYNDENGGGSYQKKRRIQRACDICRRKKIRCDGVQMPGNRCSNCIAYSFDCTYVEAAKKRGPPKGYVESLENRVERLEKLLKRLCPDEAVYKKLTESLDNNWMSEKTPSDPSMLVSKPSISSVTPYGLASAPSGGGSTLGLDYYTSGIRNMANEQPPPPGVTDDDDDTALILSDNLKRMELEPHEYRFFGKSSGAMLIRTAIELKNEYTGADNDIIDLANPRKRPLNHLRNEFWTVRPWEKEFGHLEPVKYSFPEADLAKDLVDLYFKHTNIYLPLLHRPTFERWIEEGLHLTNSNFAPIYLLVCAVGARHSSDPRVRLEGISSLHSCGWKWFEQLRMVRRSLLAPPTLFDLQAYCLVVQYLQGSSAPQSCWTIVGIGIRLAQDVGAHRRKVNSHKMTMEDEMWKRAFWVLVCMDRMISSSLGRPCAIQDEDFDLDLPVDCDDEYWDNEDPEKCFKQPPNKPSSISHFILYLKLHQILAFSLRTIYSINKSKVLLGFVGQQWEQHIVAELDSALNKWVDSVPDHLRWDPNREDEAFFSQSVSLYAAYYHVQILIHRPFIPSPSKPSPLSFPSLAICTNAARSCCHVVDIQRRRNVTLTPQTQMAVFTSGIVLLLSIWGGKRSGLSTDPVREMAEVHKCMHVLRKAEDRWHSCGRLWDILYELASVGDLPLPQSPPSTNKRERDSETPMSSTGTDYSTPSPRENMPRSIAGSRRVHKESSSASSATSSASVNPNLSSSSDCPIPTQVHLQQASRITSLPPTLPLGRRPSQACLTPEAPPQPPVQYYSLPVYSNELGRLPLHGQVAFSSDAAPMVASSYWGTSAPASDINVASGSGSGSVRNVQGLAGPSMSNNTSYPNMGEMSSMTTGFEMDSTAIAAGMMFDAMAGTLNFGQQQQQQQQTRQQQPIPTDSGLGFGVAPGMERLGPGGGFMDGYRGLAMDTSAGSGVMNDTTGPSSRGGSSMQHNQDNLQGQNMYSFVDNDTIAMWSNAPAGFELDDWGTYLNNVSELTQHGHQLSGAGTGNTGGSRMQQQHHTNHMT